MTLLTYNILDGGHGREKELCDVIAAQSADVILLQEVAEPAFVKGLAERLGTDFYLAETNSQRTIALLSRAPICEASSFHPRFLRHTCLQATLEYAPQQTLRIFGVHLCAPAYTLALEMYRLRELRLILKQSARQSDERLIVAGDFNSIARGDKPDFRGLPFALRLSIVLHGGTLARQVIDTMRAEGFTDAFRALHPDAPGYTLPALKPNTRLDYFFVNDALRNTLRGCEVVKTPLGVTTASDHLPVRMELAL